jgi:hypothetical protein
MTAYRRETAYRRQPASPHFSHPFYCDWLRPAPASFRPELSLGSMFSYSPAGNPVRALMPGAPFGRLCESSVSG